jgi:hypothetical protein
MSALGRLADPRLRPAWYGAAAAAALAAFVMTGAVYWFLHPWRFAGLLAAGAAAAAWAQGLFGRHEGRHAGKVIGERPRRQAAAAIAPAPDTTAEIASMARLRGLPAGSGRACSVCGVPRTDISCGHRKHDGVTAGQRAGYWAPAEPLWAAAAQAAAEGRIGPPPRKPAVRPESAYEMEPPSAAVIVTGDPPGRHERPRAYQVTAEPYCSRCGTSGHWRSGQGCEDAVVGELLARRRDGHVAAAVAGHLEAAGLKAYGSEEEALESMWTRAMGNAVAAVEGARRDG